MNDTVGGETVVIFTRAAGPSGAAFRPSVDGERLTFDWTDGAYRDRETGSVWNLAGVATSGPLAGTGLEPIASRTAYWFSYRSAFPEVEVWGVERTLGSAR